MKHMHIGLRIAAIVAAAMLLFTGTVVFPGTKTFAAEKRKKLVGVDVSAWNGKINWAKAQKGGVDFAIIRIGWGDNVKSQDDSTAVYNMQQCEKYNIPYGVYIYSYALTSSDVDSEVAHIIRMSNGHTPELGYWFDMEDADAYKANHKLNPYNHGKTLTNFCLRFLRKMKEKGFDNVGVYANPDYFNNVLSYSKIKKEGMIWLAHWGVNAPGYNCEMWQYSATGRISGGSGNFDMNIIYSDSYLYPYALGGGDGNYKRVSGINLSVGDMDGDGAVTNADLELLKKRLFSEWDYSDLYVATDINEDGTVNLVDLAHLKKLVASSLPAQTEEEADAENDETGSE